MKEKLENWDLRLASRRAIVLLCFCGPLLSFLCAFTWEDIGGFFSDHIHDFTSFYVGAELVGTPQLYDVPANLAAQQKLVSETGVYELYVRLPYFAALLRPFKHLRYLDAVLVWKVLLLSASIGFILIFPLSSKRLKVLMVCSSLPLSLSFILGQDTPLLLLWIALALRLRQYGKPFLAGCVLALCAEKWHLFVLIPFLLAGKREWKMAAGLAAGGCTILASCFALQGVAFLPQYYMLLASHATKLIKMPWAMTNLAGTFWFLPNPELVALLLAVPALACIVVICRRHEFEIGFAVCILGGLLISAHGGLYDWTIAIPALLVLYIAVPSARLSIILLGSPLLTFPVVLSPVVGPAWLACTLIVAVACLVLFEVMMAPAPRITWRNESEFAPIRSREAIASIDASSKGFAT